MSEGMVIGKALALKMALTGALAAGLASCGGAVAQASGQAHWAAADDPAANQMIEYERRWATLDCAGPGMAPASITALIDQFIAADFIGTSPAGALYGKSAMLPQPPPAKTPEPERDCQLLSAKLRYFAADVAIIYGKESALLKGADGRYAKRTLAWTDTWLLRAGKWRIIAVQDMVVAK